jgi:hypothetical protein
LAVSSLLSAVQSNLEKRERDRVMLTGMELGDTDTGVHMNITRETIQIRGQLDRE